MAWGDVYGSNSNLLKVADFKLADRSNRKMIVTISNWEMKDFSPNDKKQSQRKLVLHFFNSKTMTDWEKTFAVNYTNLARLGMITGIDVERAADEKTQAPKLLGWEIRLIIDQVRTPEGFVEAIVVDTGYQSKPPDQNPHYEFVTKLRGIIPNDSQRDRKLDSSDVPF